MRMLLAVLTAELLWLLLWLLQLLWLLLRGRMVLLRLHWTLAVLLLMLLNLLLVLTRVLSRRLRGRHSRRTRPGLELVRPRAHRLHVRRR